MKKSFIFLGLLILTACATYKNAGLTQADANRAATRFPGTTLADLNAGKTLFETKCGKCHNLNKPFDVPEAALTKIMPQMAGKANIDQKSQDLVYAYLITARTVAKRK